MTPQTPNAPFRVMKPALSLLCVAVQTALAAVYTKEWPHKPLAAKIMTATELTKSMKNPTRTQMLSVLVGWYSYATEMIEVVEPTHPSIAHHLRAALDELTWLKPLYDHVTETMKQVEAPTT